MQSKNLESYLVHKLSGVCNDQREVHVVITGCPCILRKADINFIVLF